MTRRPADQRKHPHDDPPTRTQGTRTAVPSARAAAGAVVPVPPQRFLLVSSPGVRFVAPLLVWVRSNVRPCDVLVVRELPVEQCRTHREVGEERGLRHRSRCSAGCEGRAVPGVELYAQRIAASLRVQVERVPDPLPEVAAADLVLVGVGENDPDDAPPCQVLHASALAGLQAVMRLERAVPLPSDEASQRAQRRAVDMQRQWARDALTAARDEALEVARRGGARRAG